ncbi:MAG: hypothetical protein IH577_04550 [Deltaproteobacteria bacterium]|nr:hypothetical protein [Deltaproteobacteria bacterium]
MTPHRPARVPKVAPRRGSYREYSDSLSGRRQPEEREPQGRRVAPRAALGSTEGLQDWTAIQVPRSPTEQQEEVMDRMCAVCILILLLALSGCGMEEDGPVVWDNVDGMELCGTHMIPKRQAE